MHGAWKYLQLHRLGKAALPKIRWIMPGRLPAAPFRTAVCFSSTGKRGVKIHWNWKRLNKFGQRSSRLAGRSRSGATLTAFASNGAIRRLINHIWNGEG